MSIEIRQLAEDFFVAPQLSSEDMAAVAEAGFKTGIINRRDHEGGAEQPTSTEVSAAAQAAGMQVFYQPVVGSALSADDALQLLNILQDAAQPVLAYCRSGARCEKLF